MLTSTLRSVTGAMSYAMEALRQGRQIIVAKENSPEVGLIYKLGCLVAEHLLEACAFLEKRASLESSTPLVTDDNIHSGDLCEVIGQQHGKRALEIAAAGGHNLLFIGPPGTGKTMLASRLNGLLPPISD